MYLEARPEADLHYRRIKFGFLWSARGVMKGQPLPGSLVGLPRLMAEAELINELSPG